MFLPNRSTVSSVREDSNSYSRFRGGMGDDARSHATEETFVVFRFSKLSTRFIILHLLLLLPAKNFKKPVGGFVHGN
ncbi:hypothetical protein L6452_26160 [Arctium lappa]|uniref:Uncharacterized protein n=1 Tax=Arctium lappa TaxID=4217 RepID=A0ACB9AC70_ARCLA|nr:hypothetical protein L6452_26160 [Arctium lappa]